MTAAMRVDLFYDQKSSKQKVTCPVLALNGSLDLQVLPKNLVVIENVLNEGGINNLRANYLKEKTTCSKVQKLGLLMNMEK